MIRRIVAVLAALFAGWLGLLQPATAATPPATFVSTNTYDSPHSPGVDEGTRDERGPPEASVHHAVDRRSHGVSTRQDGAAPSAVTTYPTSATTVQVVNATTTTGRPVGLDRGDLSTLPRAGVAAKTESRVLSTAGDVCKFNSFTGTTLVLMGDGTKKPIKDVELGDTVMATDPETGESGPRKVVDLIRHSGPHTMVAVRLADGATIDATAQHPFWVESRDAWVDAIDLKPGDIVVDASGDLIAVAGVGISEQDLTAYNLTVAGLHTYYAGEDAVLVHNSGCTNIADLPASAVRNLTEDSNYAFSRLSQNHGVTRVEFREQIHMIKRNENLPADFNLSFGPTGDVWNPRTGELIGSIVHGG